MVSHPEGEAHLDYVHGPDGRVDFVHTFVPVALRGRGMAEALVTAALEWAQVQSIEVSASCSYVARYLERHPQRGKRIPAEGS
ncbi:MAG: N-acetyltransferase [Opitutaceae bacterium]|nr:N-acetyltransferase [Opitutaceae bacterium]